MKIAIATIGDSSQKKLWSGVPLALRQEFSKQRGDGVCFINWKINKWILRFYYIVLGKVFYLRGTSRERLLYYWGNKKIKKALRKTHPDFLLFVGDFMVSPSFPSDMKTAMYGDANVVEYLRFRTDEKGLMKNSYLNHFNRVTKEHIQKLDLIFTQNEWTRLGFIRDYHLSEDRVINVHFGVNLKPYCGDKDYTSNMMLIVVREGTEEYKGLCLLLKAMPYIRERIPDAELAVVGTKMGEDMDGVRCYYNQPRETTINLFQRCVLYTMPALAEPNGITYLEGLANRAPIVGLNRFAFPEFSGNGEWGFVCNHEDPQELARVIIDALSDKKRLKEMGEKGQKYVMENFVWEKVVQNMIDHMTNI